MVHFIEGRFAKIRRAVETARKNIPDDPEEILQERKVNLEFVRPENERTGGYGKKGETRRQVTLEMFEHDKDLPDAQKAEIVERMIQRYFEFSIGRGDVRGHVEAPHGTKPSSKELIVWCKQHKVTTYEFKTAQVAQGCYNHAVFRRPRLTADINSLLEDGGSMPLSERAVVTKEDNLTAIAAQRELIGRILEQTQNLNEEGKARRPHLAVFFHGKVNRGEDIVIGAKQDTKGRGLIDPLLALWVGEQLEQLFHEQGVAKDGRAPTVKIMTISGKFSGSPALKRLRYGDGLLDFKGFGEMLQCVQLECSAWVRKEYAAEMSEVLNALMERFEYQFDSQQAVEGLSTKYQQKYHDLKERQLREIVDP